MGIIKASKLIYEYIKRDEEGNPEGVNRAVDQVDIDIQPGQFVAILGHNGSGKSTLAKHMNALLLPTEGTIWVGDKDTSLEDNLWDVRRTAGMVFQNPDNQIIGTVVEEDVGFGPENLAVPTEEIWKRVDRSLEAVGMTAYRYHSPNKLSGGQKQRVAIAGIIAMRPDCIVLDEPTAMLDPYGREAVIKTVKKLNKEYGITVVLITHYMTEAAQADRIVVMTKGKIEKMGTPREIFSQVDYMQSLALDVPQTSALAHEVNKHGFNLSTEAISIDECAAQLYKFLEE